jgi:c-di-GMP-related signal transduction protein
VSACLLARQPIYNQQLNFAGYELLFRDSETGHATFTDGDQTTGEIFVNSILDFALEQVVGNHAAYINVTQGFIHGELPLPELKGQIVLEVLEDICLTPETARGLAI